MTKIYPEDKWFSLYIRARDNWTCQRCGRQYEPYTEGGDNSHLMGLHNAHCFGRGAHATRWDEENCLTLDYGCHSLIDSRHDLKEALWKEKIGEEAYSKLEARSHQNYYGWKKDRKDIGKKYRDKFREILLNKS
jgi:hypothetical protein